MPFGLTNAPVTFQRAVDILLSGVNWQFCLVYLDDIIVYSKSEEDHIRHVDEVLSILRKAGLSLKFKKSNFFCRSVDYLGHRITPGRLEVALKRKDTLEGFQFPTTQTQVRSFLGMCNVYRRFVKDFAKIPGPLTTCLRRAGLPNWNLRLSNSSERSKLLSSVCWSRPSCDCRSTAVLIPST